MKIHQLHDWKMNPSQAIELQRELAKQVSTYSEVLTPELIAGVDVSIPRNSSKGIAAVVVLDFPELKVIEIQRVEAELSLPYIPGLLSFRECPVILEACSSLKNTPDLFMVDGQGIAHPRRLGLASHLGLFLDVPSIGCAKSILCGTQDPLAGEAGSFAYIVDQGEVIGAALRTRLNIKPVYVSIGHKIDIENALYWVGKCCRGYRLPEPTRLAHQAAGGKMTL